ncbi:MAG: bifunctional 4-hydroxy-2-oxoglutarate aldolase/2-dehydro-3-deoxy-phosphogluconate aldolase [Verrucomicrobia bacterium]|nr:bifunctional 4-hydroxy-2-oxoglutarate aldolase/2-dehydro-3-deoxy-phosphogluconate aldolase [Verrucomicrobiota bacterium]MBV8486461.1 bifunctional 4-hydroxy-2-oxoglutarate aldolase/2-dehydro-3-deoxy-phosphogluconate aldolase [Verrucomicrobiota bacterium]
METAGFSKLIALYSIENMTALLADLRDAPLVAILRRPRVSIELCAGALIEAGVRFIEVTIDSPGAVAFLESAAKKLKQGLFGAGTVTTPELAEKAIRAGARFLVTPNFNPEVIGVARSNQIPIFSGAMTPTEIFAAYEAGAEVIKVFPAATLGSAYFKELRGPFPKIPLMATGGITVDNAPDFFAAGATALGVGGSLALKDETPTSVAACQEIARKLLAPKG